MNLLQVYDPPMCCSTGVCGTQVDLELVSFAVMLAQLRGHGIAVERYNLGQEPLAFVNNPAVKALLEKSGTDALPVIFQDGVVLLQGRYPTSGERKDWLHAAQAQSTGTPS